MPDRLGGQRIGIVLEQPVLDGAGAPVLDEFRQAELTESTVWVAGCLFEIQTPGGLSGDTDERARTNTEIAWCLMPVVSGSVPAVTADRQRLRVGVADIRKLLYDGGKPFVVQGKAAIEFDDNGREDHVFVECRRRWG